MGRRVVVGTAGHIDHGKTALVRALTGIDTDRWEEEKRRGITIDLGFAPFAVGEDITASIVDVPGHEGFVRNMVAGATGIDVALLVVAADEGTMPQTEEHLAILELLGVRHGVPVLAKADLVEREWLDLVRAELTTRLTASRVHWEAPVVCSAVTGQGLDEVRSAVRRIARNLEQRAEVDLYRLPIDRAFAVAGAGTVVTGTTWSGTLSVGEAVQLLPAGRDARVRSIEAHGAATDRALPGRRTALALVGVRREEITRGDVAVTGDGWHATTRLEADIELLPGAPRPLAHRTRVRVHLGTAEVLARVVMARPLEPGGRSLARLALERPLVARGGDRFVLRSFSPVTTIGGGIVTDPFPRWTPGRAAIALGGLSPAERVRAWIDAAGLLGVDTRSLPVRLGVTPGQVPGVLAALGQGVLTTGELVVARAAVVAEGQRLATLVDAHHAGHPLEPGMSRQALRATVGTAGAGEGVPATVADLALDLAVRKRLLVAEGAVVRRPDFAVAVVGAVADQRERLARRLGDAGWEVPTIAELMREFPDAPVRALLANLAREGRVEQMDPERYADPEGLRRFRAALTETLAELVRATPAQLRARFGLTRKYLIPLLEWADRRGLTRRDGDARTLVRLTDPRGAT